MSRVELPPMPEPAAWTAPFELWWVAEEHGFGKMCHVSLRVDGDVPIFTRDQLRGYGESCAREALFTSARLADDADKATHPADLAGAIRALSVGSGGSGA